MSDLAVQIVTHTIHQAERLSSQLKRAGIPTTIALGTIGALTSNGRDLSGPILVTEEALTSSLAERLFELIDTQPDWSDLPLLLLLTPDGASKNSFSKLLSRGSTTILEKPLSFHTLASVLQSALHARRKQYQTRDAIQALDTCKARMRSILRSNGICVEHLDLDGNLLAMDFDGQERIGIPNFTEIRGASSRSFWKKEESSCGAEDAMKAARSGSDGHYERHFMTSKGESVWWDIKLLPELNLIGEIDHLLAISHDITPRKQAEQALIQSEKLATVGRLVSSIAHEINNPLAALTNLLYLARLEENRPEVMAYLDIADQELRRVSIIVNQTLRFHKQSSSPQAVSPTNLLTTVLTLYQRKLNSVAVQVEMDLMASSPVSCFEGDIRQVVSNLVANAIDAMSHGGRLILRTRELRGKTCLKRGLVITVADTGDGMSPVVQSKIFDPFFTTKGIDGNGLGLWISQEIVKRHHGNLTVRSRQRKDASGTVFRLFLPAF
ncbi:two-component system sensor histidine kinase NtrB [Terriglobus albidus]|nr:ATP-binding protein [Terriglobus albidus]